MATLAANPITRHRIPAYPTKLKALTNPDLLRDHIPAGWLSRREIAGALGAFIAANAGGCADRGTDPGESGRGVVLPTPGAAIVAPLFEHGDGRGRSRWALACIAVAAPSYLPEDEALAVIRDELRKYGLRMDSSAVEMESVVIQGRELKQGYDWVFDRRGTGFEDVVGPLEVDLMDPGARVAVEYVAADDFDRLGGDDRRQGTMDIKGVAESVGRAVAAHGDGVYFGAFYDPVKYYSYRRWDRTGDRDWAASPADATEESKQLLRQQVQDFVDWLKGQGVL